MSLLDSFLLAFETDGLKELTPEVKGANKELNNFEKEANKAEKANKKLDDSLSKNIKSLKTLAATAARTLAPFVLLGKAINETMSYASQAIEVAEAAAKAGMSIEQFQRKDGNKYILFSREDINNAKEFEQTMRDVRMGTASIGSNIAKMLLPALITLAKVAKQVVDWFVDHADLVKAGFIAFAIVITAIAIPAIINMGIALWTALAPILPIVLAVVAAIAGIALVIEDIMKWVNGEDSVAELLFGDFETFKNNFLAGWEKIKSSLAPYIETFKNTISIIYDYFKAIGNLIRAILSYALDKAQPLLSKIGIALNGFTDILKNIGKFVLDIVDGFLKLAGIITKITTKGIEIATNKIDGSHASGLDYVPFDNYVANLHKGEAVLTESEADDWRSGVMAAKKAIDFTAAFPLNSIPSGVISNAYNNDTSKIINIGDITINTQATDSEGIAADFKDYIKQAIISLDDGMLA